MFVFVLTDSLGVKQYAFCKRRQLVKRDVKYFPECICLLSHQYDLIITKKKKKQEKVFIQ